MDFPVSGECRHDVQHRNAFRTRRAKESGGTDTERGAAECSGAFRGLPLAEVPQLHIANQRPRNTAYFTDTRVPRWLVIQVLGTTETGALPCFSAW